MIHITVSILHRVTCAADSPPIHPLRQAEIDALPCKCWYFDCYKDTDALPAKRFWDPGERRCLEIGVTHRQSMMPIDPSTRQNPVWHESAQYGRVTAAYEVPSARELIHDACSDSCRRRCCTHPPCRPLPTTPPSAGNRIESPDLCQLSCTSGIRDFDSPWLAPQRGQQDRNPSASPRTLWHATWPHRR